VAWGKSGATKILQIARLSRQQPSQKIVDGTWGQKAQVAHVCGRAAPEPLRRTALEIPSAEPSELIACICQPDL
jgi:hypothetical protein